METRIDELVFEFANEYEFTLWVAHCKENGITVPTSWRQPDHYTELMKNASQLYEERKIPQAMVMYRQALQINPVGIVARFEIAQCYIVLKQYTQAKSYLLDSAEYFQGQEAAAHFYRKMGFIAIEERNWKLGMACYVKSLSFVKSSLAAGEIKYIVSRKGEDVLGDKAPEHYIKKAGLPVMSIVLDDGGLYSKSKVEYMDGI